MESRADVATTLSVVTIATVVAAALPPAFALVTLALIFITLFEGEYGHSREGGNPESKYSRLHLVSRFRGKLGMVFPKKINTQ